MNFVLFLEKRAIPRRVENGKRFLNSHEPNWRNRLDADSLNIAHPCECIGGQLHGSFEADTAYPIREQATRNGFFRPKGFSGLILALTGKTRDYYQALTEAWQKELASA